MTRLAAVTGATGFLGRYVVGALAASGWRVRILARRPAAHPQLEHLEFETIRGDLSDAHALRELIDGADMVIHAAALIKARSAAAFRAVNVDGTVNVAKAVNDCRRASRVVLVSSLAAREPQLSSYARTKRTSEEVLARELQARHTWTVVRPCAIYGPWDRETLGIFRAVLHGIAPRVPAANARIALLHAVDAARAIAAICDRTPAGVVLELADERPEGYAWEEIISAAERALGVKAAAIRVPRVALRTAAALNLVTALALGRTPMLTPGKAREILHADWGSTTERQPPREWWRAEISLEQGFRQTVSWYRSQRWLSAAPPRLAARGAVH